MTNRMNGVWAGVAGMMLVLAGGVQGQDKKVEGEPVLKGPAVKDNSSPGQNRGFGGDKGGKGRGEMGMPMPVFMQALGVLRGENAQGELKLSEEQEKKIQRAGEEFQASIRAFYENHKDEILALREQLSPQDRAMLQRLMNQGRDGAKGRPQKDGAKPAEGEAPPMMTDGDKAVDEETATKARERVKALMESRPRPEDAQAKVMGVLNEAQKKALQGAMTRLREDGAKKGKAPEAGAPGKPAKELSDEEILNDPRLPERMKEKLKGMSAEERAEALKRLRDRLSNADGPGKRGAGGGGEEKKAPSSKDVKVPAQPK